MLGRDKFTSRFIIMLKRERLASLHLLFGNSLALVITHQILIAKLHEAGLELQVSYKLEHGLYSYIKKTGLTTSAYMFQAKIVDLDVYFLQKIFINYQEKKKPKVDN